MVQASLGLNIPRAVSAARALVANPDDLPQVFTIIESLSMGTLPRVTKRWMTSESGRRLLEKQPDIVELLADRAALAKLPEGSLGRAYLDFVESEGISAEGIRAANEQGKVNEAGLPPPLDYVHARMRDTHDLWHALTGYRGDVLGEIALLAFTFAQTKNPGIGLMIGIGFAKVGKTPETRRLILDGFRRGFNAAWLPAQEWEGMLALPVAEVRARLSIEAPPEYVPVRSAELRERVAKAA